MGYRVRNRLRGLGMLAATLLLSTAATAVQLPAEYRERGYIRIAIANEVPYGYVDSSGSARGVGPDVAVAVLDALGVRDIQWIVTNFKRLIPGLKADRFDIVAAEMAILPGRCRQVLYSEPNSSYGEGLLLPATNPLDLHSFEVFARRPDLKIAIMAGADHYEILTSLGVPEERMVILNNNVDAIAAVAGGRADAYAATSLTASNLAARSDLVEVAARFRDPVIDGRPVRSWGGFAFGPEDHALRDAFNVALLKFKQTDEWRSILARHGFTDADIEGSFAYDTEALCAGATMLD
jgi:polar amino acid transport system substrate-binding protein